MFVIFLSFLFLMCSDVDDIDLYTGGLAESAGSTPGETFQCLLGKQFERLKHCDRFFYQNTDYFTCECFLSSS